MAFSTATITHTFLNATGTPASGQIEFTLTGSMRNGATTLVPAGVTSNLTATGQLSQVLTSNVDTGTIPAAPNNTQWRVDVRVLGAEHQSFVITVPTGGGSIDLGTLLPATPQVG